MKATSSTQFKQPKETVQGTIWAHNFKTGREGRRKVTITALLGEAWCDIVDRAFEKAFPGDDWEYLDDDLQSK